jgi:hypothetical protein
MICSRRMPPAVRCSCRLCSSRSCFDRCVRTSACQDGAQSFYADVHVDDRRWPCHLVLPAHPAPPNALQTNPTPRDPTVPPAQLGPTPHDPAPSHPNQRLGALFQPIRCSIYPNSFQVFRAQAESGAVPVGLPRWCRRRRVVGSRFRRFTHSAAQTL